MKKRIFIILGAVIVIAIFIALLVFWLLVGSISENAKDNTIIDRDFNWSVAPGLLIDSSNGQGLSIKFYADDSEAAHYQSMRLLDEEIKLYDKAGRKIQTDDFKEGDSVELQLNAHWCYAPTDDGKNNDCILKIKSITDISR